MKVRLSSGFYADRGITMFDYSSTQRRWVAYFAKQYSDTHKVFYQLTVTIPNEEMELMNIAASESGIDILRDWVNNKALSLINQLMGERKDIIQAIIIIDGDDIYLKEK